MEVMAGRTLLVDLDGTVWDSAPWFADLASPSDRVGADEITIGLRTSNAGMNAAKLIDQSIGKARFARACREQGSSLHLYDGCTDVLDRLSADGVELGVVTSLPGWMAKPMLAVAGIDDLFAYVQCAQRGVPAKPNPIGLRLAMSALGSDPRDTTYVGDALTDAGAARAADVAFIWASWGYGHSVANGDAAASAWSRVADLL
jgi:HAD superfamily hydrolase (TIGR01549 family)